MVGYYDSNDVQEIVCNKTDQVVQVILKVGYSLVSFLLFWPHCDTWWRIYSVKKVKYPNDVMDDEDQITNLILMLSGRHVYQN